MSGKFDSPYKPENIDEIIAQIKQAVSSGNWREHTNSPMWAGKAIAPILNLDAENDKRQIKKLIDDLLFRKILIHLVAQFLHQPGNVWLLNIYDQEPTTFPAGCVSTK